ELLRVHAPEYVEAVQRLSAAGTATPSPLAADDAERAAFLGRATVAQVMTRDVVTVGPHDTVEDAACLLHRHRIGALPVVDAAGGLLGMLSESDVVRAFVEILSASGPASRLEVALPDRPGELARAVRILGEELGLNLNSVLVPPAPPGAERRTAIVHLATIDPREAVAALEAAGFQVGWPSLEGDLRSLPREGG
ncbi:MAG TPA: CBS domain-containing protein, partial [Longimicrobiaceae bacterium]|nr:CBS domain-containing protein [Longimicrobiaceae bacterium]